MGSESMVSPLESVLRQAMSLTANDRAAMVDALIVSLDKPDPAVDSAWLKEAESRLAAYHAGEIQAVEARDVFIELGKTL